MDLVLHDVSLKVGPDSAEKTLYYWIEWRVKDEINLDGVYDNWLLWDGYSSKVFRDACLGILARGNDPFFEYRPAKDLNNRDHLTLFKG